MKSPREATPTCPRDNTQRLWPRPAGSLSQQRIPLPAHTPTCQSNHNSQFPPPALPREQGQRPGSGVALREENVALGEGARWHQEAPGPGRPHCPLVNRSGARGRLPRCPVCVCTCAHWGVHTLVHACAPVGAVYVSRGHVCTRVLVRARVQAHWLKGRFLLVGLARPGTAFLSSCQGPGLPPHEGFTQDRPLKGRPTHAGLSTGLPGLGVGHS